MATRYSSFLPAAFQGTRVGGEGQQAAGERVANLSNPRLTAQLQRRQLDLLQSINRDRLATDQVNPELEGVIESYELAFRMQGSVPQVLDFSSETPETLEASKVETAGLMIGTRFKPGALYEDYREGDKNSGMGLRALVVGGTGLAVMKAAKAGILIKLLLVFKKGFIFIIAGIVGLFKMILGRKKDVVPETPPPSDDPPANV